MISKREGKANFDQQYGINVISIIGCKNSILQFIRYQSCQCFCQVLLEKLINKSSFEIEKQCFELQKFQKTKSLVRSKLQLEQRVIIKNIK